MNIQTPELLPAPEPERDAPPACKCLLALLTATPEWDPELVGALEAAFGSIDYRSPFVAFSTSADEGYYSAEMGGPLWRGWVSFRGFANPRDLPAWKHRTRALEESRRRDARRTCNLDIGYMDSDKLVLASFKRGPLKLYLDAGVWGDVILGYYQGAFLPVRRTFPDFQDGRYDGFLRVIREKMKAAMRAEGRG